MVLLWEIMGHVSIHRMFRFTACCLPPPPPPPGSTPCKNGQLMKLRKYSPFWIDGQLIFDRHLIYSITSLRHCYMASCIFSYSTVPLLLNAGKAHNNFSQNWYMILNYCIQILLYIITKCRQGSQSEMNQTSNDMINIKMNERLVTCHLVCTHC